MVPSRSSKPAQPAPIEFDPPEDIPQLVAAEDASLSGHDLPDDMRQQIEAEFTPGEEIVWVGRPIWKIDPNEGRPSLGLTITGIVLSVLGVGLLGVAIYCMAAVNNGVLIGLIPLLGGLMLLAAGVATLIGNRLAASRKRNPVRRPCYVLTNQRALIHSGGDPGQGEVRSYYAPKLAKMQRNDPANKDDPGGLIFDLGTPGVAEAPRGFLNIADAPAIEKLIRRTLIDRPAGDVPRPRERPAARPVAQAAPPLASSEEMLRASGRLSAKRQEQVLEELGRGEVIVWVGGPDPKMWIVRKLWIPAAVALLAIVVGLIVMLTAPDNMKPMLTYIGWGAIGWGLLVGGLIPLYLGRQARRTLYVLTNRRALVWTSSLSGALQFTAYNAEQVSRMYREDSKVFGDGAGDLVFRTLTIIAMGNTPGPRTEVVNYGFVGIRRAAEVERLIRLHLIEPYMAQRKE